MIDYCSTYPEAKLMAASSETRKRVLRYLKTAARKGNAEALCNLGAAYYGSCLVRHDFTKAVKCYEASARKGCVQAMSNLGYCHYYGRDIPVDYDKAYQWFLKAYVLDRYSQPEACYKLGDCFLHGRGTAKDAQLAFALYSQAYKICHSPSVSDFKFISHGWDPRLLGADAASRLGDCWMHGTGCKADLKKAIRYYRIAVAGFSRRVELADEFASALLRSAKARLADARETIVRKRKRRHKSL